MKAQQSCPKCEGTDIVRVPGRTGIQGAGSNIPAGRTIFSEVKLDRYVCLGCGFVEHYVDDPAGLKRIGEAYRDEG